LQEYSRASVQIGGQRLNSENDGTEVINTVTDFSMDLVTEDTYYLINEAALPKWDCYLGSFGYD
jgi:hypothetical protein